MSGRLGWWLDPDGARLEVFRSPSQDPTLLGVLTITGDPARHMEWKIEPEAARGLRDALSELLGTADANQESPR